MRVGISLRRLATVVFLFCSTIFASNGAELAVTTPLPGSECANAVRFAPGWLGVYQRVEQAVPDWVYFDPIVYDSRAKVWSSLLTHFHYERISSGLFQVYYHHKFLRPHWEYLRSLAEQGHDEWELKDRPGRAPYVKTKLGTVKHWVGIHEEKHHYFLESHPNHLSLRIHFFLPDGLVRLWNYMRVATGRANALGIHFKGTIGTAVIANGIDHSMYDLDIRLPNTEASVQWIKVFHALLQNLESLGMEPMDCPELAFSKEGKVSGTRTLMDEVKRSELLFGKTSETTPLTVSFPVP